MLWTIGYEKLNWGDFIKILKDNGVNCIVDVRLNNFSMRSSYRGKNLAKELGKENIRYIHMPEFGNPYKNTEDWQKLFTHRISLMPASSFQKLTELMKEHTVALLCYEKNPLECHRSIIANELVKREYIDTWQDLRVPTNRL
ncbi:MAG: DUF488 domain-containing protein [Archaeoglobaceae archaeon]